MTSNSSFMKPYTATCLNGSHFRNLMLSRMLNTMFSNGDEPLSIIPEVSLVKKEVISQFASEHPPLASSLQKHQPGRYKIHPGSKPHFFEGCWTVHPGLPSWRRYPALQFLKSILGMVPSGRWVLARFEPVFTAGD